jgi:hypothetical protein
MSDGTLAAALQESNDILQDEVSRLRETNATLRVVIRALRRTNESLRQQVSNAAENDDTFKRFCEGEFDEIETQVVEEGEGVFPEPEDGGTIESTL